MFSRYTVIPSKNNDNFAFSFPVFILLTSFCFLIVWASTSRTVLITMVLVEIFTLLLTVREMLLGTDFAERQLSVSLSESFFYCVLSVRFQCYASFHKKNLEVFLLSLCSGTI